MEKLNLTEMLKDCPTGMELDCTMFDDVTFVGVNTQREFPIEINGQFYVHDGYSRIDYDTSYVKGWYIDGIDRNLFPEVTYDNSPQQVEIKLIENECDK